MPETHLSKLSATTKVDYYAKVLHGKKLFKTLFDLDKSETVRRSSISKRLSKINSDYFRQIYQCGFPQFYDAYPQKNSEKYHIEVFFRFIKQKLHVSHLVSFNKNGIEVYALYDFNCSDANLDL